MSYIERIQSELTIAMREKDELRLSVLRMVKSSLKYKEIEKVRPLDDLESLQVLQTLVKQRRESVEQFTKGNRPQLAEKEQLEIAMIEGYLPKAASEEEIRAVVQGAIEHLSQEGQRPSLKDLGTTMRVVQQRLLASGVRADGKLVSEIVKAELAK